MQPGWFLIFLIPSLRFPVMVAAAPVQVSVKSIGENTSVITLQADIQAGQETVWGLLTDYDHHAGFLPYITKSHVTSHDGESHIVEQEGMIKILFWSFTMHVKQRVWEISPRLVHFMAIDGDFDELQGDFKLSVPTVFKYQTRLLCEFRVKPKRRVPDWAVRMAAKHYLRKMVAVLVKKAERGGT